MAAAWRLAQEAECEKRREDDNEARRRAAEDLAAQHRQQTAAAAVAAAAAVEVAETQKAHVESNNCDGGTHLGEQGEQADTETCQEPNELEPTSPLPLPTCPVTWDGVPDAAPLSPHSKDIKELLLLEVDGAHECSLLETKTCGCLYHPFAMQFDILEVRTRSLLS